MSNYIFQSVSAFNKHAKYYIKILWLPQQILNSFKELMQYNLIKDFMNSTAEISKFSSIFDVYYCVSDECS